MNTQTFRARRARLMHRKARQFKALAIFGMAMCCLVTALLATLGFLIARTNQFNNYKPMELTQEQRSWNTFQVSMQPMDIIVHVLSTKDFIRLGNEAESPKVAFKDFIAWSHLGALDAPCEVFVPAGYLLEAQPTNPSSGDFVNSDNSGTFAHEFLHCTVGRWHAE